MNITGQISLDWETFVLQMFHVKHLRVSNTRVVYEIYKPRISCYPNFFHLPKELPVAAWNIIENLFSLAQN